MKDEQLKDLSPSELPEDAVEAVASDADFEFIPSPEGLSRTELFLTEDVGLAEPETEAADESDGAREESQTSEPTASVETPILEQITSVETQASEPIASVGTPISEQIASEQSPGEEVTEDAEHLPEDTQEAPTLDAALEDGPVLCAEDILAATESREEQISFFDEKEEVAEPKQQVTKERAVDTRFDFLEICIYTLVAVLLITTFFFRHSIVDGSSMEQTLSDKEHLILASFLYTPETGDIVVCEDYSTSLRKPIVKRVIATEGQTVEIYGPKDVYVDGVPIDQSYAFVDGRDDTVYPIVHTVAEGHVFVMGDHRNASTDSRVIGDVSVDSIIGKVVLRFSPFTIFD